MGSKDRFLSSLHGNADKNRWEYLEIRTLPGMEQFERSVEIIKDNRPQLEPIVVPSQSDPS